MIQKDIIIEQEFIARKLRDSADLASTQLRELSILQAKDIETKLPGMSGDIKPINLAYITSCRELDKDESIGREVIDKDNGVNYGYREGNLENLAKRLILNNPGFDPDFSRKFNLVSVIIDDTEVQYKAAWEGAELWPRNLSVPITNINGNKISTKTIEEMTVRIPSQEWKDLRRNKAGNEIREEFRNRKAETKAEYEKKIITVLEEKGVDIVISDSYTTMFARDLLHVYKNRIINIHPGITEVGSPYRLPGLTPTRDAYTRAVWGYIIINNKHRVDIPKGEHIKLNEITTAVKVPKISKTGVTVHVVNEEVDRGPVILSEEYFFNPEGITPEKIRTMNYKIKRELLPKALLAYVNRPDVKYNILRGRK